MYIGGMVGGGFLSSWFGVLVGSLYSVCLEAGRPAAYSVLEVLAWAAAQMLAMPPWALLVAFAVFWLRPIASYLAKGASLTEAVREARIASGAVEAAWPGRARGGDVDASWTKRRAASLGLSPGRRSRKSSSRARAAARRASA